METSHYKSRRRFYTLLVFMLTVTGSAHCTAQEVTETTWASEVISSPCFGTAFGRFNAKANADKSGWILDRRKVAGDPEPVRSKNGGLLARVLELTNDELTQIQTTAVNTHVPAADAMEFIRHCGSNDEVMKAAVAKRNRIAMNQALAAMSRDSHLDNVGGFKDIASALSRQKVELTEPETNALKAFNESKAAMNVFDLITRKVKPTIASRLEELAKSKGKDDVFGMPGLSQEARQKILEGN